MVQCSDEWFKAHKGRVSASHATAIANVGKGLDTYILETMANYYSSGEKEHFSNQHTDRGNELEPLARDMFELETDYKVQQVGLVEYNDYVCCSPDGLIDEDGGLEIKCVDDKKYFEILMDGEKAIDSGYRWQCLMNLLITERKWWKLCYYNPNFERSLIIFTILPDQEKFKALLTGFSVAEQKIKELKDKYNSIS